MKSIHLVPGLSLPLEVVTEAIGIVARRRAGKSYLARRFAEQLLKAQQQVVIVDPKGDWWGIRSSADGKGPGFPVTILGGERGDVPLEASAGEVVAKLAVEERANILLDLSLLRKHEHATFMADFLEGVYRLKAREDFRTAMMLVIDEADSIAPQSVKQFGAKGGNVERMLGAANDIVRRGGQRGIGCTLITQRSAVLNKDVLTQCQILIALRTIAPQDLEAIKAWIDVHGTPERRKVLMESLPSLPRGDAWVWSPGWPTEEGIFHRGHTLPIETFDSGATPGPGEKRKEPKAPAAVDLEALKRQMAATIERAKADDPRELRRRIAVLEKELVLKRAAAAPVSPPKKIEVQVLDEKLVGRLEKAIEQTVKIQLTAQDRLDRVRDAVLQLQQSVRAAQSRPASPPAPRPQLVASRGPVRGPFPPPRPAPAPRAARQRILDALAFIQMLRPAGADRVQLALLADQSPASSGYANNLGALRSSGLIDYPSAGVIRLTTEGAKLADSSGAPTTSDELQGMLRAKLPPARWRIVEALIKAYPDAIPRGDLAEAAGQSADSSGFANNLGGLRSFGLIDYPSPGTVRALPVLFLE